MLLGVSACAGTGYPDSSAVRPSECIATIILTSFQHRVSRNPNIMEANACCPLKESSIPSPKTNNTVSGPNAMIGVATAHCEMSLDMDDLVTMKST
jgi:hypothetical protein